MIQDPAKGPVDVGYFPVVWILHDRFQIRRGSIRHVGIVIMDKGKEWRRAVFSSPHPVHNPIRGAVCRGFRDRKGTFQVRTVPHVDIGGKTPVQSKGCGEDIGGNKGGRLIALLPENVGKNRDRVRQSSSRVIVEAQLTRVPPAQERRMGRQGHGDRSPGIGKVNPLVHQPVDRGGQGPGMAITAQPIHTKGIDGDQENVRESGW